MKAAGRARVVGMLTLITSVVLTLTVVGFTWLSLAIAIQDRQNGYCETIDHPGKCESEGLTALVGFALTGLGLWGAAAGVGLLVGRPWARRSAMLVFSAWAILLTAAGMVTTADDVGIALGGVAAWLLIIGYFVAIVVLADRLPARQAP